MQGLRKILCLLGLVLGSNLAFGQTSAITATISDTDGTAWSSGPYTIQLVNSSGQPIAAGGAYRIDTGATITNSFSGTLDGSGALSVTLTTTSNINPAGTKWKFGICPNTIPAVCGGTSLAVSASGSFSSQLSASILPPRIGGGPGTQAYADVEVAATPNNSYLNVGSLAGLRCYGSSWAACGGGGGTPTGAAGGALNGTYPNPGIANVVTGEPVGGAGGPLGSVKTLSVDLFSTSGCTTISLGATQTQFDCAWGKAYDQAVGSGNPVDLYLGVSYYSSCIPMVEPTAGFYGVNLIGSTLGATTVLQNCPTWNSGGAYVTSNRVYLASTNTNYIAIANSTNLSPDTNPGSWTALSPVPMISKTAGYADIHIKNIRFNGQNRSSSCADLAFISNPELENLDCTNILSGSDHMWQFGSNSGFASGGSIINVLASPPYGIAQTYATITPTFTSTALTGLSCAGSCGAGYSATYATGIVNDPHQVCTTLPSFTVTITSGAISGFTITNAGNCSSAPDFLVTNQQNITAGMRLYVSDSSIINVQPNNGVIGAELYGGNNHIEHLHPTAVQTCLVINNIGNALLDGLEPDTCATAAVQFVTNQATVVSGLLNYSNGGPHLPGQATFQFTSTSNNVNIMGVGALCPVTCSTDYQEFIGPSGVLTPGGTGWPTGVCVYGNDTVSGSGDYCHQLSTGGSVSSVSNSDSTLTISPTTGAAVASLNLGHANTWTGNQSFNNQILALHGVRNTDTTQSSLPGTGGFGPGFMYTIHDAQNTTTGACVGSGSNEALAVINSAGNGWDCIPVIAGIPPGTATFTAGTNVTSAGCASGYTCTNLRGEITIVGGTATTGTIATVNFAGSPSVAPGLCWAQQNGGATSFNVGHDQPTTSGFHVSAAISVSGSTVTVDYGCIF